MIDEITQILLVNKNEDEIRNLLGNPEDLGVLSDVKRDFLYCLGKGYGLTAKWLVIHLNKERNFDRFEIIYRD